MNSVTCTNCGTTIGVDKALEGQIEARVLAAEQHKHQQELERVRNEQADILAKERAAAESLAKKQLEGEKALLQRQAEADLALLKKSLEQEAASSNKKAEAEQAALIRTLTEDAEHSKKESTAFREQLTELTKALREERTAKENAEFEAQKKMAAEESKIREEVQKVADERHRFNLAEREKTITDLQKALDEAQRKAAQGSQQLQGEIMELDLEAALEHNFRDDDIRPVAKGTRGGDILQIVKSPRGTECGSMLWEIKRTKNWVDGWVPKLKEDVRSARASIAIIVTEVMPKHITEDIGQLSGVWICKPQLALMVSALLRKSLLDAGMQKAIAENRGDKAEALYNFVTGHEFIQQVESMVETYQEMTHQVQKERVAYEKLWAAREKQAQKLFMGTANIIGSMQGHVGQAGMLRIKGLELDDGLGED